MSVESEANLEAKLIERLSENGYEKINIKNEDELNIILTQGRQFDLIGELEGGTEFGNMLSRCFIKKISENMKIYM